MMGNSGRNNRYKTKSIIGSDLLQQANPKPHHMLQKFINAHVASYCSIDYAFTDHIKCSF